MSEQLTLTGEIMKQVGIKRAEDKSATFVETMRTIARGYSILYGKVNGDQLRKAAAAANLQPNHPNAWGAIWRCAGWVIVGRVLSDWPTTHRREIKEWKWEGEGA